MTQKALKKNKIINKSTPKEFGNFFGVNSSFASQYTTSDLVAFDGLKQGFEIAFAETVVIFALNKLEKYRSQ